MKNSVLINEMMTSPLTSQRVLRPKSSQGKKSLYATVILTSLVDAFSILVIYLIFNSANTSEIMKVSAKIQLPTAQNTLQVKEESVIVKHENGVFFVNNKKTSSRNLIKELLSEQKNARAQNKKINLIIQADQKDQYKEINKILVSSAATGFEKIKFAVIVGGSTNDKM